MSSVWLIARRELVATLRSPLGFVVATSVLLIDGLLFNVFALGSGEKLSTEVITQFFWFLSGVTMIASVFISMRLLAEERQNGSITLLLTSPVKDYQVILGKFLGGYLYLALLILITIYMPMLVLVNGKVSWGHLFSGYLGMLLLGAASFSIGIFGSSLSKSQIVAVVVSAAILVSMLLLWLASKIVDAPLKDIVKYLALHEMHFRAFMTGNIHLKHIVFYLSITTFFLFLATRMLESRRWR